MVNHPNRSSAWKEGPFYDRGDGSIGYVSYSSRHPGIARVQVRFYAKGRGRDQTYYLDERDLRYSWTREGGQSFDTLKAAIEAR